MMKAGGTEIGKTLAEKSRGLFSANDWQCKTYGAWEPHPGGREPTRGLGDPAGCSAVCSPGGGKAALC